MENTLLSLIEREGEREMAEMEAAARRQAQSILDEARLKAAEIEAAGPTVAICALGDRRWVDKNASLASASDQAAERILCAALSIIAGLSAKERLVLLKSFWSDAVRGLPPGNYEVRAPEGFLVENVGQEGVFFELVNGGDERVSIVSQGGEIRIGWSLEELVKSYFRINRGKVVSMILE